MPSQLVNIEHSTVAGSAWVPEDAYLSFWGPVEGWTLVAGSPTISSIPAAPFGDALLKEWVSGDAYELLAVTVNAQNVITSATVKWPDGSGGTFTATAIDATLNLIDAFTVSHNLSGKVVTQAAVSRNANGAVTIYPPLSVV